MTRSKPRTAVAVDRHPMWLDAVRRLLHRTGIQVVATSTSAHDVAALVDEHRPDLLLVDAEVGIAGIDAACAARRRTPALAVVVFVPEERFDLATAALGAGALAVVLKTAAPDELLAATRQSVSRSIYTRVPSR